MKKYFNTTFSKIFFIYLFWRIILILVMIFALQFVPLGYKDRFLGGGSINYHLSPELFSWANFDGEHYLSVAIFGYKPLELAFFPVYPILISFFAHPFSYDYMSSLVNSIVAGVLISNISLIFALFILWKLIRIDYSSKISWLTIILILVFPTSFYFGSLYNESLFLLLSVASFYFGRKGKWFLAGITGGIASATRVFGVLIFFAMIIEAYQQKAELKKSFWITLIPLGLMIYIVYQYFSTGDPFEFYHLQTVVGEQHQSGIILLPQVYFRYFKMFLTVDSSNPIYQTILLEFAVGILFFILPIIGYFKKVRLSYLFYALAGFLAPTIQGSFSSLPRYVLVLFPSFLVVAILLDKMPKFLRIGIIMISFIILLIETTLFLRGYWIA